MALTDGISSLQTILGSLSVNSTKQTTATRSAEQTTEAGTAAGTGAPDRRLDQASLSSAGGLVAKVMFSSDVRLEKVTELQAAIASGTYKVSAQDVAHKMIESLLS